MEAYQKSFKEVQQALGVSDNGLSQKDVIKRQTRYGRNEIIGEKRQSVWGILFDQFKDLLVIILICAGIISAISGEFESTLVILCRKAVSCNKSSMYYWRYDKYGFFRKLSYKWNRAIYCYKHWNENAVRKDC